MKRSSAPARMRILPLALAALAAAGCDGEPYVRILPAPPYPLVHTGESVQPIGVYARDHAVFPFASSMQVIYDSQSRPEAFGWESSNSAVATVGQDGTLRALAAGVSDIRVTAQGLRSRPDTVTVIHALTNAAGRVLAGGEQLAPRRVSAAPPSARRFSDPRSSRNTR
jgi:hypothetical protein